MRVIINRPENDLPLEFDVAQDCNVSALKSKINERSGVPFDAQHIKFEGRELKNKQELQYIAGQLVTTQPGSVSTSPDSGSDVSDVEGTASAKNSLSLSLTYELEGSSCFECCGIFCVCKPCQCYFRTCCFNSGCDLEFNQCQAFCWKCFFCPTDNQKVEAEM
ncbi:hypothetical protein SARC_11412 [Sphaeroforma arctica JP610]|uniref:Ubiquitin-like domain-containing protein n=1 Tax=Sphaeroforma arctica JP610 TaxID=667725 RepID=A0A0L0FH41_9EUKA|nr:hypothetical protein SARC_11412 [Sphaeroforma arctica JP610]KNC76077.1 hypothetical protein SARC_11412 [Sphaeroforma arctica JP610]|eukprot:XP_014149979.1 hypothetical protein SARC_11412 [Sphaeroforma arctica JP610]